MGRILPAVYSGVEFAKSKGWIKKSKPAARPGAHSVPQQRDFLVDDPSAERVFCVRQLLIAALCLAPPPMCSRRIVEQRGMAARHSGRPQDAQEADVIDWSCQQLLSLRSGGSTLHRYCCLQHHELHPPLPHWSIRRAAAAVLALCCVVAPCEGSPVPLFILTCLHCCWLLL